MSLTQHPFVSTEMQLLGTLINIRQQYESVLGSRVGRGWQLADAGKVTQVAKDVWKVQTLSGKGRYIVDWTKDKISCSCRDGGAPTVDCFCGVKADHCCIHIIATVMIYVSTPVITTQPVIDEDVIEDDEDVIEDDELEDDVDFISPPKWNSYKNVGLDSYDLAIRNYGPAHSARLSFNGH